MSSIPVQELLAEVSPDLPCGENLEYDAAFQSMEVAAKGKAEQQFGDTIVEAEEPDWREVKSHALAVLQRSRDLRAAVQLTIALARTDGLAGVANGLQLIDGLIDRHWDHVHPQLDPDDGNDPMFRMNTLARLTGDEMIKGLREAPLVESRVMGRFNLRDIDLASGMISPSGEEEVPRMSAIQGAFLDGELEDIQANADAIERALATSAALDQRLLERVGSSNVPNLDRVATTLRELQRVLLEQLARRGVGAGPESPVAVDAVEAAAPSGPGQMTCREDAIKMIEVMSEWFQRHEPSSPVPLLLLRAKRLISKNFMEILRDIAPGGVSEAETIGGVDTSE